MPVSLCFVINSFSSQTFKHSFVCVQVCQTKKCFKEDSLVLFLWEKYGCFILKNTSSWEGTDYSLLFLRLLLFIKKTALSHHLRLNQESVQQELVDTTCSVENMRTEGFPQLNQTYRKINIQNHRHCVGKVQHISKLLNFCLYNVLQTRLKRESFISIDSSTRHFLLSGVLPFWQAAI